MRRFYTLLLYLALPWASLGVLLRGLRHRDYWHGWRERFGAGVARRGGGLWVHAVSVGEVQAAVILVEAVRARAPAEEITLTCATPTGRARARTQLPDTSAAYAPYDLPGSIGRFLRRVRPSRLVVIETELWPNLLYQAWRAGVPTLIASARVSERTARLYRRLPGLLGPTLAANVWVAAQSSTDAQRFAALGVPPERLHIVGNIKFDRGVAAELQQRGRQLRERYAAGRPVWVAGSTHPGEEAIVLEAHRQVLQSQPSALLVLAPRHPPRFDSVAEAIVAGGFTCVRRSLPGPRPDASVLLLDTLGELVDFYAAGDVAFVGGSLTPVGGHNLLEPAAIGIPVLTGPYQSNSPHIARVLSEQGALITVRNATALAQQVSRLLKDPQARAVQGAAAHAAMAAHRGALAQILELIARLQPSQPQ